MKKSGCLSFFLLYAILCCVLVAAHSIIEGNFYLFFKLTTPAAMIATLYFVFIRIMSSVNEKNNSAESGSIESYMKLSGEELTKKLFQEEMERKNGEGVKIFSKSAAKWRIIITACFSACFFILLSLSWINPYTANCSIILACGYIALLFVFNTGFFLHKKAKKFPDKSIEEIIELEAVNKKETHINGISTAFCAIMIFASVGLFVILNAKTEIKTVAFEGGHSISRYNQGLFDNETEIIIPETVNGKAVVSVSERAFANNKKVKSIALPDTVLYIEKHAFSNCTSLSEIKLSEKTVKIGSAAFKDCSSIENIELPKLLTELGGEAFMNCIALKSIEIPEGVTEIRGNSFEGCQNLESVTLHDGIVDIHAYAFTDCSSLTEIELPPKITEIHANTFEGCKELETIEIPPGVTRIAAHAFEDCSSLYIANIPDTLTEIGSSAFRECDSLEVIFLPENVSISENSFKESPTKLYKKQFNDETQKKIDEELENKKITQIYAAYYTETGEPVVATDCNGFVVSDSEHLQNYLSDEMSMYHFTTPSEFLEFLKKYRTDDVKNVQMNYYSEIASEAIGSPQLMYIAYDIDELIESYEKDPTEF